MKVRMELAQTALAFVILLAGPVQAVTVSVVPVEQTVPVGESVDVAIDVSGLGDGPDSLALAVFDLDVGWDAGILSLRNADVTFGDPALGDQLDLFALGSITDTLVGDGSANLFELSLDLPSDLHALQAGSFTLATLAFGTLGVGTSTVDVTVNSLGDAWGDPISANVVDASVSAVPEPSAAIFFCIGSLLIASWLRSSFVRGR